MNLVKSIERAIEQAPLVENEIINDLATYADAPDDEEITVYQEVESSPDTVYADPENGVDLGLLLQTVDFVLGVPWKYDEAQLLRQHEGQHYRAAQMLGATGARYCIIFCRLVDPAGGEPELSILPAIDVGDLTTTKLGLALFFARPQDPSENDLHDMRALGYASLGEVARKAAAHNRSVTADGIIYPEPMSLIVPAPSGGRLQPGLNQLAEIGGHHPLSQLRLQNTGYCPMV